MVAFCSCTTKMDMFSVLVTLNRTRSRNLRDQGTHICSTVPPSHNFHSVRSPRRNFQHFTFFIFPLATVLNFNLFKTNAPNAPKMTSNTKAPHACDILAPTSPRFQSFVLYGQAFSTYEPLRSIE